MQTPPDGEVAERKRILRGMYRHRRVKALALVLFGVRLTSGQARIVQAILYRESPRIAVSAYTQYGKTWCVALAVCLLFIFTKRPLEVQVISATASQADKVRQYLAAFIAACPQLADDLSLDARGIDRIQNEVSRKRLTFKTGHSVNVVSAHGRADRLMGLSGDIIIKDEAGLFTQEADAKIARMIGGRPEGGMIIELGNPWTQLSAFYKSWTDPAYLKIRVSWEQGVMEGRITLAFVEEQRRRLPPILFVIFYDSNFPEDTPDALFKWAWVQRAIQRHATERLTEGEVEYGADIAEAGTDSTVLVTIFRKPGRVSVRSIDSWHKADTMRTAADIAMKVEKGWRGKVDAIGVGKGVCDRLRELDYNVSEYKSSNAATQERFRNRKAEDYWSLRDILEKGARQDGDEWASFPEHPELIADLLRTKYEIKNGKIRVYHDREEDVKTGAGSGSPDFSDALVISIASGGVLANLAKQGERRSPRDHKPGDLPGVHNRRTVR